MGEILTGRSFKSGNSVAIRMPAELGIEPGKEWAITVESDGLVIREKSAEPKKLNVDAFWGLSAPMIHTPAPREEFEARPSERDAAS